MQPTPMPPSQTPAPSLPDVRVEVAPPAPPIPGQPPAPPGPVIVTTEGTVLTPRAAPRTAQELAAMREQRKWLSDQLQSAQSRRRDVARALEQARDPVNQNGLQARLQVLDRRIVQIENEIGTTGQLMATAPAAAVSVADVPRPGDRPFDRGPSASVVLIVFIVGVLLPMAVALGRILTRRFAHAAPDPAAREAAARLARLEQAVDAIAVEVERVSEGQRFVTRLLADARGQTEAAPALRGADTYRPQ